MSAAPRRILCAVDGVVRTCSQLACDLFVLGTRGLSPIEPLLLGSAAEGVLWRCPVPLLTVRK